MLFPKHCLFRLFVLKSLDFYTPESCIQVCILKYKGFYLRFRNSHKILGSYVFSKYVLEELEFGRNLEEYVDYIGTFSAAC